MDYQEAINILRRMMNTSIPKQTQGISTAISAMRELQMYRDGKLCLIPESVYAKKCAELDVYKQLGTLEEMKLLKETHLTGVELAQISCMLKQLAEYEKIGTLEEVLEAVERQQEKQVINIGKGDKLSFGTCPICNRRISNVEGGNYCQNCGHRLDWRKKDEY